MSRPQSEFYESYWTEGQIWSASEGGITPDEATLFAKYLRPGTTCLDYGCGDARRYGKELTDRGINYRGFDISATALTQAWQRGVPVDQLTPEGTTTLKDNSCDVAICFEVLEHLQEPDRALAEIFRVLKPGGHLLTSTEHRIFLNSPRVLANRLFQSRRLSAYGEGHTSTRQQDVVGAEDTYQLLSRAGPYIQALGQSCPVFPQHP